MKWERGGHHRYRLNGEMANLGGCNWQPAQLNTQHNMKDHEHTYTLEPFVGLDTDSQDLPRKSYLVGDLLLRSYWSCYEEGMGGFVLASGFYYFISIVLFFIFENLRSQNTTNSPTRKGTVAWQYSSPWSSINLDKHDSYTAHTACTVWWWWSSSL